MKAFSAAFSCAVAMLLGACADPIEQPTAQEAGEKFQRGIRGEGTVGPIDRSHDPYVKPAASETLPNQ